MMPAMERGRRARSDEDKESRRAAIVAAARRLLAEREYAAISAEDIARGAGLSKGSLFFYFPTKEEVFLALAKELFGEFFDRAAAGFAAMPRGVGQGPFVEGLGSLVAGSGELLGMLGVLDALVERNVTRESLVAYKRYIEARIAAAATLAAAAYPPLAGERGRQFFVWLYGLARGFLSLARPGELASRVIREEGIALFAFDFEAELKAALAALLAGMEGPE